MDKKDIEEKIIERAKQPTGSDIKSEESLKESGIDSLALVTLIVSIEDEFKITFSDDDLNPERLRHLSDLVNLTEKYL